MEKTTLKVEGMTCMGCVGSIKKVLSAIPGVKSVDVVLESGKVTVEYDESRAQTGAFKQAIEDAGYDVVQ